MELNGQIRITVVVITYNQENVISRCLDSILSQKEYGLKEIIVSDDCSLDTTWNIIQEYKNKYPQIIVANRNYKNKGIYGNLSRAYEIVHDTDFVINCSGDDIICEGFFERVCEFAYTNKLNPRVDSFVIYGDYKIINSHGQETIVRNNVLLKDGNAIDFRLRHLLSNRSSVVSICCFSKFDRIPYEKSLSMAEEICDLQQVLYSDNNYYIPVIGSAYYMGLGVSTKMGNNEDRADRIDAWLYLLKTYKVCSKTKHSMLYDINRLRYANNKSIVSFFLTWYNYIMAGKLSSLSSLRFLIKEILLMLFSKYNTIIC